MMTILEEFAHWITGGSVEGYPSGQRVVFYGTTAPEELTLEEFAEQFERFLLKKYNIKKEAEKDKNEWTDLDDERLGQLVCLCNLWQDGGKETLLPKRAYDIRNWLREKFPNAPRYKRPLVPIENLTWEQWKEVKNDMCEG